MKRGDIYFANLDPVVGSEQGGVRPVLIIQNNVGNRYSPTVIVAIVTCRKKKSLPTHVPISDRTILKAPSIIMLEQIRTIDKTRVRNYIASVSDERLLLMIDSAMRISLAFY